MKMLLPNAGEFLPCGKIGAMYIEEPGLKTRQIIFHALLGAFFSGIVITIIVFTEIDPVDMFWPANWRVRPLTVSPLFGGIAGAVYYCMQIWLRNNIRGVLYGLIAYFLITFAGVYAGLKGNIWY